MRGCPREFAECDAMLHCQRRTEVMLQNRARTVSLSVTSIMCISYIHILDACMYSCPPELLLRYGRKAMTDFQSKCKSINDSKKYSLQPFSTRCFFQVIRQIYGGVILCIVQRDRREKDDQNLEILLVWSCHPRLRRSAQWSQRERHYLVLMFFSAAKKEPMPDAYLRNNTP